MITPIDPSPWSPIDLTGNSAIVWVDDSMYIVGSASASAQSIYLSDDLGRTWAVVGSIPVLGSPVDPVVVADGSTLHIVIAQANAVTPSLWDVVKYTFDTDSNVLSPALPLVVASKVATAYDIVALGSGSTLVVTSAFEPRIPTGLTGAYALLAFEVSADGTYTATTLNSTIWSSGATNGSLSLVVPGGSAPIELYYTEHNRSFTFKDAVVTLSVMIRTGPGAWNYPQAQVLTTCTARFVDDKLTCVVTLGNQRALAYSFYNMSPKLGLQTSILYGAGTWNADTQSWSWVFQTIAANQIASFKEPVIETDGINLRLSYIACPVVGSAYSQLGELVVADVDPSSLALTIRNGGWPSMGNTFKWLRGTKAQVPVSSKWAIIGIQGTNAVGGGGTPLFLSEYSVAPVAVLSPASVTLVRGQPQILDASGVIDLDSPVLTFTWEGHPSPGMGSDLILTPFDSGRKATAKVPAGTAPYQNIYTVIVTVTDDFGNSSQATSILTLPEQPQVDITMPPDQSITRNTETTFTATTTNPLGAALTYLWQQTAGTAVELLGTETLTVQVKAYRVAPGGETLTFSLTVTDGVNQPVSSTVNLQVSSIITRDLDVGVLSRAFFNIPNGSGSAKATISQRHAPIGKWGIVEASGNLTNFTDIKLTTTSSGSFRESYISPKSCLVVGVEEVNPYFSQIYPPSGIRIVDAGLDEFDQMYILTGQGPSAQILLYTSQGVGGVSDWPDDVLILSNVTTGFFQNLDVLALSGGSRILVLYGTSGVLLLRVLEGTAEVLDLLLLDVNGGYLPAINVQWVRTSSLTSTKRGQILVGVMDAQGNTTEVLIDVSARRPVGTWDRSNLVSQIVNTGEIVGS